MNVISFLHVVPEYLSSHIYPLNVLADYLDQIFEVVTILVPAVIDLGSLDTSKFSCSCIVEILDILRQLRQCLLHVLLDVLRQGFNNEVNFVVLLETGNQVCIEAVVV